MAENSGVVFLGQNKVEVQSIDFPKMQNPAGKKINHGVILKVVSTNICGSDQHMVRGRTTAPTGMVLGHEITGEIIEAGADVEYLKVGDLVTVPFNVACGRCRTCREQQTGVCLNVNPGRAGGAYGYVDMGGWVGGQAKFVMVPYADFNLIKFPDKAQAMAKIKDLTMLSDILPTGFHGAVTAGVEVGSIVYIAGAGPVGLAAAAAAQILGAAVGFEAKAQGKNGAEAPATVLNSLMSVVRAAGGIGIPGLYVTEDPGAHEEGAKQGNLKMRFGLGWAKSHRFYTGQTPVLKYNRQLMQAILHDRLPIAKIVNATVISLNDAPQGYQAFDSGVAKKFVLDPHGLLNKA